MTAQEAFERVQPHLAAAGVTRVADITGLDRIGIPTFISVRPMARTLSVDSGKGTTIEAARTSAAFESIERHVGESVAVPFVHVCFDELKDSEVAMDLPRVRGSVLNKMVRYRWAFARDVNDGGRSIAVPLAAVKLMAGDEMPLEQCVWASTSNGLAASTSYDDAVFQGLCEVIERDACACHQYAGIALGQWDADKANAWFAEKCFDPLSWLTSAREPLAALVGKIQAAGCEIRCFDYTMPDTLMPVVQCFLYEPNAPEAGMYKGYGAHPDSEVAVRRAITEAVQARCVIVAGARDDIDSATHERTRSDQVAEFAKMMHGILPTRKTGKREKGPEDFKSVAEGLKAAGFARVLVYDFGAHFGAHVVRVIVPGLSGYWTSQAPVDERMEGFVEGVRQNLQNFGNLKAEEIEG